MARLSVHSVVSVALPVGSFVKLTVPWTRNMIVRYLCSAVNVLTVREDLMGKLHSYLHIPRFECITHIFCYFMI